MTITKQEFLDGKAFSLDCVYGDYTTFTIYTDREGRAAGLHQQHRGTNNKVLIEELIMNIDKVGTKMIHVFTYLLGKKVADTIRYADMKRL
jgi:hypothetical protein